MAEYPIIVLPVLAMSLIIFFGVFVIKPWLSRSLKTRRRRRRRTLLVTTTLLVLLASTYLAIAWPIDNLNRLAQIALMAAMVLIPFYTVHWILTFKFTDHRRLGSRHNVDSWIYDTPTAPDQSLRLSNSVTEPNRTVNTSRAQIAEVASHKRELSEKIETTHESLSVDNSIPAKPLNGVQTKTRDILKKTAQPIQFYDLGDSTFKPSKSESIPN